MQKVAYETIKDKFPPLIVNCLNSKFIIWFSHAIRLVKSGLQFVFKILNYIVRLIQYDSYESLSVSDLSDR